MQNHRMTFHDWLPNTRQNKIALCVAIFSLLLMIGWNLAPMYDDSRHGSINQGIVVAHLWLTIYDMVMQVIRDYQPEHLSFLISCLCLVLLACLQFTIVPFWRIFSQSKMLRFIPIFICLLGFLYWGYMIISLDAAGEMYPLYLITINFPTTCIALLLFTSE